MGHAAACETCWYPPGPGASARIAVIRTSRDCSARVKQASMQGRGRQSRAGQIRAEQSRDTVAKAA